MDPSSYLNGVYASWPLYRLLYRKAIGALAPVEVVGNTRARLVCGLSLVALAGDLDVSASVVREDMRRLSNWGWIIDERPRYLGMRSGGVVHLVADTVAEEVTGCPRLISTRVLKLSEPPADKSSVRPRRGIGSTRRFEL